MKLDCSRKDLADALILSAAAASVRSSLPILQSIRLEAQDSMLVLLGCDGEMWVERRIAANIAVPGAACVASRLFSQIVGALPDGIVTLELSGNVVRLTQGASEFSMLAFAADEFPTIPEIGQSSEVSLQIGEFRDAVGAVSYAVADDNSRPVLTGVYMNYDGERLTLVATDTHRLAAVHVDKAGIGARISAIVPEKALRAIRNLPLADSEQIVIRFEESRISVDAGDSRVVSQLLVGQFPAWERVVPSEATRAWTLDREELTDRVKRAMIYATDSANRVKFSGHGDQVLVSARSEDKGEGREEVAAVMKNGDIDVAFNGKYVLDALTALKGDGIRLELTESLRPAVFRPIEGGEHRFCVIMPMALS